MSKFLSVLISLLLPTVVLAAYTVSCTDKALAQQVQTSGPPSPPAVTPSTKPAESDSLALQNSIELLRMEIAQDSLNPQAHYELANALHDADKREEAILHYDKAIALKPDFAEALVNRGAVLNELGRIQDAIASFKQALAINPRDTRALLNLGNSFYALQLYNEALKQYERSVEIDSTFVQGYYYIGIAFADAGIFREAIREWEKIIAIAPNSEAAKTAQENIDVLKRYMASQ